MKTPKDWLLTCEVDIDKQLLEYQSFDLTRDLLCQFSHKLVDEIRNKIVIEKIEPTNPYHDRYRTQAFLLPKSDISNFLDTMSESEVFADKIADFLLWMRDNNLEPNWSKGTNKDLYRKYLLNRKQNNQCNY